MIMVKKYFLSFILIIILALEIFNIDSITNKVASFIMNKPSVLVLPNNEYKKNLNVEFVKENNEFIPFSKQDIIDIYYSVLNNGWEDFTFYCPSEYEDCIKDLIDISNDTNLLTNINNFVHPFNSFSNIETTYDISGEVNIKVTKLYTDEEINIIEDKIDNIYNEIINDKMNSEEKILTIHDYIINNAKYDIAMNETKESIYHSNKALGPLVEGYAICSGYTDAMALFLIKLGVPNYKISNDNHVWNGLYINGNWYHLDLTWDDPFSDNGKDYLLHQYFLIDTEEMLNLSEGTDEHNFDRSIYLEFNMEKDI